MTETVPQSQRRYIQTALIVALDLLAKHYRRPWWKRSSDTTAQLEKNVVGWEAELARHDREYGDPGIPANPAWDEFGQLRPARGCEIMDHPTGARE